MLIEGINPNRAVDFKRNNFKLIDLAISAYYLLSIRTVANDFF